MTDQEDRIRGLAREAAGRVLDGTFTARSTDAMVVARMERVAAIIADAIRTALMEPPQDRSLTEANDLADGALAALANGAKEIERLNSQLAAAQKALEKFASKNWEMKLSYRVRIARAALAKMGDKT